jgi:predicted peroxiredoxin
MSTPSPGTHAESGSLVESSPALAVLRPLVLKCTAGAAEPERCTQAFTVAATALAAGARVSLWLTGDAVWFAVPGHAEQLGLPHSAPLSELRDAVLSAGRLTVCTQCAARRELGPDQLIDGTLIAGSASFVAEVLAPDVQALVY